MTDTDIVLLCCQVQGREPSGLEEWNGNRGMGVWSMGNKIRTLGEDEGMEI